MDPMVSMYAIGSKEQNGGPNALVVSAAPMALTTFVRHERVAAIDAIRKGRVIGYRGAIGIHGYFRHNDPLRLLQNRPAIKGPRRTMITFVGTPTTTVPNKTTPG